MQMTLSDEETKLIHHYRAAQEHDRSRIRILTEEAAEVAERLEMRRMGWRGVK